MTDPSLLYISHQTQNTFTKVSGPDLITNLDQTPMIEWCMVRCGLRNAHQRDMHIKKIKLKNKNKNELGMCSKFINVQCST